MAHMNFEHQHTAHCESGVASSLLKNSGLDFNEAMVFGLASALTFAYLPIIKLAGMPLIAYRMPPKSIIKNVCKRLQVHLELQKFKDTQAGMRALDQAITAGKLVGLQTSVYWLPYFPKEMRFHFNAHNILVYGKEGDEYLISDPVLEVPVRCGGPELERARFAKGALAGKGLMYTIDPQSIDRTLDLKPIIRQAILKNVRNMNTPLPFIGVRGIHYLANKIKKLKDSRQSDRYKKLYLGHIVRMQEEIGTGGAGFRYIYASFLELAAVICQNEALDIASKMMTAVGDQWRVFASQTVKQCKKLEPEGYAHLSELLHAIADEEKKIWQYIYQNVK